ncbi:hypothetical protein AGR6A_Lc120096 [Agrobacterium sp. NCPPB 925]|nr:hypothetical protein AGR6A_Lc120096 [Agrobacterium sp. NCPPB 925]
MPCDTNEPAVCVPTATASTAHMWGSTAGVGVGEDEEICNDTKNSYLEFHAIAVLRR